MPVLSTVFLLIYVLKMNHPRDVRMRGFASRTSVEQTLDWVDEASEALPSEEVPLAELHRRILSIDVTAPLNVPAFVRSAMDGYAVQGHATIGATDYTPATFRLLGESMPARPFAGLVTEGACVRVMTGAPIPDGADAVVPVEYTTPHGHDAIAVSSPIPVGKHIGRIGEDVSIGSTVLSAGRPLRPQDIGLLASLGLPAADVVRRPRVRILTTGNELVVPGEARTEYQIFDANTSILETLCQRDGAEIESIRRVSDDRKSIAAALTEPGADVLLVSGGSSVGQEDHAPGLVAEFGELAIHGIAMRPSSPAGMGFIGRADEESRTMIFLLPGNPVSCLCAYDFFAGRAIRRLAGASGRWPYQTIEAELQLKIASMVGRTDYCRVQLAGDQLVPLAISGASILSSTTRADGFVIVPANCEGYAQGTSVTAFLYDDRSLPMNEVQV